MFTSWKFYAVAAAMACSLAAAPPALGVEERPQGQLLQQYEGRARVDMTGQSSDLANARRAYARTLELHPGDSVAQMGLERLDRKNPGALPAQ